MDFQIIVNDNTLITDQYQDALDFIARETAQWNNFYPEAPMYISIKKVSSQGHTLGIHVNEIVDTKDVFGNR